MPSDALPQILSRWRNNNYYHYARYEVGKEQRVQKECYHGTGTRQGQCGSELSAEEFQTA